MILKDLTKVYISEYEEEKNHGEIEKKWKFKGIGYLNLQQDINELDRKSTGEIDYSRYKGRTTKKYNINKGDGISLTDITKEENFKPEYKVLENPKIGDTYLYVMEKIQ